MESLDGIQSRFDIGVKFQNGLELYEAFSDFGSNEAEATKKNLENFTRSSLHVMLDAFNDTEIYEAKEKWEINGCLWDVFIGDYNIKSAGLKKVEIPNNLFDKIEEIICNKRLEEKFYFVRIFYAHNDSKVMATEFMINNINIEYAEKVLESLDWMESKSFYSLRIFLILKNTGRKR